MQRKEPRQISVGTQRTKNELHVHLRASLAIRFVVMMRHDGPAVSYSFGIRCGIFTGMLQLMQIIQSAGPQAQEAHQQQDGGDAIQAK